MRAVSRSPWTRVTSHRVRIVVSVVLAVVSVVAMSAASRAVRLTGVPATEHAERVVVFGIPHLGLGDLDSGDLPTLDRLVDEGAMAAASCGRTPRGRHRWRPTPRCRRGRGCEGLDGGPGIPGRHPCRGLDRGGCDRAAPGGATHGRDRPARRTTSHRGGRHRRVERAGRPGPALADEGRTTAVVGNADQISRPGFRSSTGRPRSAGCGTTARWTPEPWIRTSSPRTRPLPTACAPTPARSWPKPGRPRVGRPGDPQSRRHRSGLRLQEPLRPRPGRGRAGPLRATDDILRDVVDELPPTPCCS